MRELVQWTKLFAYANETYESKDSRRPLGLIKDQKKTKQVSSFNEAQEDMAS